MCALVSLFSNDSIHRFLIAVQTAHGHVAPDLNADIDKMIQISITLVESCTEESWLSFAHVLMPNIAATVLERRQIEDKCRTEEDRQHHIEEDHRLELKCCTAQREADHVAHEVAVQQLSLTLSRTAALLPG